VARSTVAVSCEGFATAIVTADAVRLAPVVGLKVKITLVPADPDRVEEPLTVAVSSATPGPTDVCPSVVCWNVLAVMTVLDGVRKLVLVGWVTFRWRVSATVVPALKLAPGLYVAWMS